MAMWSNKLSSMRCFSFAFYGEALRWNKSFILGDSSCSWVLKSYICQMLNWPIWLETERIKQSIDIDVATSAFLSEKQHRSPQKHNPSDFFWRTSVKFSTSSAILLGKTRTDENVIWCLLTKLRVNGLSFSCQDPSLILNKKQKLNF